MKCEIEDGLSMKINALLQQHGISTKLQQITSNDLIDRALGSAFGAMIGDALGSYAEFKPKPTPEQMMNLMKMQGGGVFKTFPGQVTDDSQMAMCLLSALLCYNPQTSLKEQIQAISIVMINSYIGWSYSSPFDIGLTTQAGINTWASGLKNMAWKQCSIVQIRNIFDQGRSYVKMQNEPSVSNGYLMRIFPLAIFKAFFRKYKVPEMNFVGELVFSDTYVTHSNSQCHESGQEFVDVLSSIISRIKFDNLKEIYQQWTNRKGNTWNWKQVVLNRQQMDATQKIGWAKIAYTIAFSFFRDIVEKHSCEEQLTSDIFKQIMYDTMFRGGDTDTNGAIVGALIGGIFGFKKLPSQYIHKLIDLEFSQQDFESKLKKDKPYRSKFFQPRNVLFNVVKLAQKFIKLQKDK